MSTLVSGTSIEFARGDLVWARLGVYPSWPAIIILAPNGEVKLYSKHVRFFGTKDRAWVKDCRLSSYDEHYEENSVKQNSKLLIAMRAVEKYKQEISKDEKYLNTTDETTKEEMREHLLVKCSNEAKEEIEKEKKREKSKRKEVSDKDSDESNQARKKPKMSPSKDEKKEPKTSGKREANKADMKKKDPKENSAQSGKASKKYKTAVSNKDSKKGPKDSKKPEASSKTGMQKTSSKGKSAQPKNAAAKPKKSTSAKNLREQKRTPRPQVIIKKSKICYLPSSGSSFIFPGPSTSTRVPETTNSRVVYDLDSQKTTIIRGPFGPVPLTLGFVGIGELASALVSHLVRVGIHVLIWNRTASKCDDLVKLGAIQAKSPADVAAESDIVFCSVRGTGPITEVCFGGLFVGLNGIVPGLKRNPRSEKGFVMMSSIRPETSLIIAQDFRKVDAQYLEAQVLLNSQSEDCDIRVLCAGNKSLFEKLPSCFTSTKAQFIFISCFLGEASRMKYAHTITHVGYALSLIEALAVLQESEKPVESLSFILEELDNVSPVLRNRIKDIIFHRRDLGGTIRELKDTLKELYEWYPRKPLRLATAAFEALEYASKKGADNKNIFAMYDLLV